MFAPQESGRWEELLGPELARGREAVDAWSSQCNSEARLARALRDGASAATLARAIQEAAAAGVKVAAAKRTLKLMQGLEAAMAAAGGGPAAQAVLRSRLEGAREGGIAAPLLEAAQRLLQKLTTQASFPGYLAYRT